MAPYIAAYAPLLELVYINSNQFEPSRKIPMGDAVVSFMQGVVGIEPSEARETLLFGQLMSEDHKMFRYVMQSHIRERRGRARWP